MSAPYLITRETRVPEPDGQRDRLLAREHDERSRIPVLAIDEAHMLDPAQLEAIRMLTNHDIPGLRTPEVAVR